VRIISGKYKGRQIKTPSDLTLRPTSDFAKESIFNIINNNYDFDALRVLDLFSGTGNISYEFLSRGCKGLLAVEIDFKCYSFTKRTFADLKFIQARVIRNDVFLFLKICKEQYHIIFADPPYDHPDIAQIPVLVFEKNLLAENGWLIVEHGAETDLSTLEHFLELRTYGKVNFSIFERIGEPAQVTN
jgi:16S rRNA (guanine966-N2)-methyltransferase